MLVNRKYSAFCNGCEFSGDIPFGSPLVGYMGYATTEAQGISKIYFRDPELRLSNALVNGCKPHEVVLPEAAGMLINQCQGDQCILENAGIVPITPTLEEKRGQIIDHIRQVKGLTMLGINIDLPQRDM